MEKSRKYLKFMSEIILICLAFSFIRSILEVYLINVSLNNIPDSYIITAKLVICVIYTVFYIPQVYIGVKGIKVAKNPDSSKAHIVWAVIFLAFAVLGAISSVWDMINTGDIVGSILGLINGVIDIALYFFYVRYAKQVLAVA